MLKSINVPFGTLESLRQLSSSEDLEGLARRSCVVDGIHATHCAAKRGAFDGPQFLYLIPLFLGCCALPRFPAGSHSNFNCRITSRKPWPLPSWLALIPFS
jgi:hypothetical protein